ncbi:hypothetical protein AVEN_105757-1 [Araneus ventricosus]|uniref:Uncharacterized protein n=1 Tax=Araneus ventricosus TaxID=182803 RepID=A0A4Y2U767_ARAVE|nr:hypothetical protein AVEN_105757-1 [Araneus ventricosus]
MKLILSRPLQWLVCQLQANQLPLRHLLEHVDRTTTGPRILTGEIRKSLAGCEKLSVVSSTPIENTLCEVTNKKDLSTDQIKSYKRIPVVDSEGEPNCCYTIESLVGQPNAEEDLYPNTFIIEFVINTQGEEYVMYSVPVMIQVKVHNRRAIVNPFSGGYSMEGGMQYNAYVSMQTRELLPSPYDTHCLYYLELWKRNNGTGPLSYKTCVEYCQVNKLLELGKCIDKNVDYPHEFQLCARNVRTLTSDIVKNCTLKCRDAC